MAGERLTKLDTDNFKVCDAIRLFRIDHPSQPGWQIMLTRGANDASHVCRPIYPTPELARRAAKRLRPDLVITSL